MNEKNDKLYWNGSVSSYNLNTSDSIDFIYLTKNIILQ